MANQKSRQRGNDASDQIDQMAIAESQRCARQAAALYEQVRGSYFTATLNSLLHKDLTSTGEKEVSNASA